jgi:hypothetical protein
MQLQVGEEYGGPGQPDAAKTRAERARQLAELLKTPTGREVIEYYFGKYTGTSPAACPPAGLLMIQTLLGHEYPSN